MTFQKPDNLAVLTPTDPTLIYREMTSRGAVAGHFTNGTYAPPESLVVPTVLAGFQYSVDTEAKNETSLIIAVNSDKSMAIINAKRLAVLDQEILKGQKSEEDRQKLETEIRNQEDQTVRGLKVAGPVALQNPDRKVFVVFYDEETPNRLYDTLAKNGFGMETLFKWGYGTKPQEGRIESAENFKRTLGFPLPNTIDPICAQITPAEGQKGVVTVVDLREGAFGYVSKQNKCLFRMLDPALLKFTARGDAGVAPGERPRPT